MRPTVLQVGHELTMFRFLEDADPSDIAAVAGPGAVVRSTELGLEVVVDQER
jgi:hypothetical protein